MGEPTAIFDFDNHYYEATDAFTRHQGKALRSRGVRWADVGTVPDDCVGSPAAAAAQAAGGRR